MTVGLIVATLKATSGIPKDDVQNSFVFEAASMAIILAAGGPIQAVERFYDTITTTGNRLTEFISGAVVRPDPALVWDVYDITAQLDGSPHGSPVSSGSIGLAATGIAASLPAETACVLTTRRSNFSTALVEQPDMDAPPDFKVDRPRQRVSGRVFLGPLNTLAITNGAGNEGRASNGLITTALAAGLRMQTEAEAALATWVQWSRKNADVGRIDFIQVDDALDTIRKRGHDPLSRTTQAV